MNKIDRTFANLLKRAEQEAVRNFNTGIYNAPCTYYGEIDCIDECISLGVPEAQVISYYSSNGKPNVFKFKNGEWLLCNDFLAEQIFNNGLCSDIDCNKHEKTLEEIITEETDKLLEKLYKLDTVQVIENNKKFMVVCLPIYDRKVKKYNWHIIDVTEEHDMSDYEEEIIDNEIDMFNYFYDKIINNRGEIEVLN